MIDFLLWLWHHPWITLGILGYGFWFCVVVLMYGLWIGMAYGPFSPPAPARTGYFYALVCLLAPLTILIEFVSLLVLNRKQTQRYEEIKRWMFLAGPWPWRVV